MSEPAETKTEGPILEPPPPEIPPVFAKYLSLREWKMIDPTKSPNQEIIAHLISKTAAALKMIYPESASKINISISGSGQIQLLMLMRIMIISAYQSGVSNMDIVISNVKDIFPGSSIERNAWTWFDNVCMNPGESLLTYKATYLSPTGPTVDFVASVITEEVRATVFGSTDILKMSISDEVAQCAVQEVIDFLKIRMQTMIEPAIEIDKKVAIRFTAADISGFLRSTWRGGNISRQFFSDLAGFGESFAEIKKYCKAAELAAKPKKSRVPKTTTAT